MSWEVFQLSIKALLCHLTIFPGRHWVHWVLGRGQKMTPMIFRNIEIQVLTRPPMCLDPNLCYRTCLYLGWALSNLRMPRKFPGLLQSFSLCTQRHYWPYMLQYMWIRRGKSQTFLGFPDPFVWKEPLNCSFHLKGGFNLFLVLNGNQLSPQGGEMFLSPNISIDRSILQGKNHLKWDNPGKLYRKIKNKKTKNKKQGSRGVGGGKIPTKVKVNFNYSSCFRFLALKWG